MTFDARTERNLATLDPRAVEKFRPFIAAAKAAATRMGYEYVAISGNRTWAEQDALYAKGRTKPGPKVTNARGGQSNHNFRIALDFGVFQRGLYLDEADPRAASRVHKEVGQLATKHGLEWGGDWTSIKDEPHFEVRTGLTMAAKRARFKAGGTIL